MKTWGWVVEEKETGFRLDQFIAGRSGTLSRNQAKKLVSIGAAYINGTRTRVASRALKAGDRVRVYETGASDASVFAIGDSVLLYEDAYILAINKPPGVNSQPSAVRYVGCVYEAVERYMRQRNIPENRGIGLPQRLDRDVSGVMVLSIHPAAHKPLTELFATGKAKKAYLAICDASVYRGAEGGECTGPIDRIGDTNRFGIVPGGKPALTRYRILSSASGLALVEAMPVTGRTHQIRIHLADAGLPIVGDGLYGRPGKRVLLHASRLVIAHPVRGESLDLRAPLPEDFQATALKAGLNVSSLF